MLLRVSILMLCLGVSGAPLYSQEAAPDVPAQVRQLEADIASLRARLDKLKQALALAETPPVPAPAPTPDGKAEKKPAPGIDLGPVHATPYGTVHFGMFGNSGGNNNADVPLFATPNGTGGVGATARQTRLGVKFTGPDLSHAQTSGTLETDFYGGFPAIGIGENFGVVRLRLAYVRLDWAKTSLIVGQDWIPFAPVNPVSLASAAIPEMAAAGNLWTRTPQIRLEHRWRKGNILWQGAVLSPASGDFPTGVNAPALLQPGTGAAAKLPYFQSRISLNDKNWLGFKKAGSIGVSALYGRGRVGNNRHELETTGVALDWNIPLARRLAFAGEGFFGRNLAGFQGGVFQGVTADFAYRRGTALVAGGPRAIGTRGGWAQLGITPAIAKDKLTLYASFGQDDPHDEDLLNLARRDARARNQSYSFSSLYKWSPQLSWGLAWRRILTSYTQSGRQSDNHLHLSAAYSF